MMDTTGEKMDKAPFALPKISCIVPVYNVEKYLRRCLDSILAQTFKDFELILIDDGSPDECPAICDEYVKKDVRVKVVHKENGGLPTARKTGFDCVRGDYVVFIDSDDWIENFYLEDMYNSAINNGSDFVFCALTKHHKNKMLVEDIVLPSDKKEFPYFYLHYPIYMNSFCNKLIKTNLFKKEDVYFPFGISIAEDLFVTLKLVFYADNITQVHKGLYNYDRTNETSITHNINIKYAKDYLKVGDDLLHFISSHNMEGYEIIPYFYFLKSKLVVLSHGEIEKKSWLDMHPECNRFIWKVPLRFDYKLMLLLASKRLFALAGFIQKTKLRFKKV